MYMSTRVQRALYTQYYSSPSVRSMTLGPHYYNTKQPPLADGEAGKGSFSRLQSYLQTNIIAQIGLGLVRFNVPLDT